MLDQAHSDLNDICKVDVLLDHRRHKAVQVVQLFRSERPLEAVAAKPFLLLGRGGRSENDRPVFGGRQFAGGLDAERGRFQLGFVVIQEAAVVDEQLLAEPAAVQSINRDVWVIVPSANHHQPNVVFAVRAALVLEGNGAGVRGEHEAHHGLLALARRHDLARQVPEEQRQYAQRRCLTNAVVAEDGSPSPGVDSGDAATGHVHIGAGVDKHHAAQLVFHLPSLRVTSALLCSSSKLACSF